MKIVARIVLIIVLSVTAGIVYVNAGTIKKKKFAPENILSDMRKVADWQLADWNNKGFEFGKTDWTNAACYTGIFALGSLKGQETYLEFLKNIGNSVGWNTGSRRFYADDYCIGQLYSLMYMRFKDVRMIKPFTKQADNIIAKPHEENLNWKNDIAMREWAWCDALFMGPPALGYLSAATGNTKYIDKSCKLWWKTTDFLYSPKDSLYFRDETYFQQKEKNGQNIFWSRGNGWVLAGLVRLMENMPADYNGKGKLEQLYVAMIKKIVSLQQPDGSWHASLLDPESYPVKETSGTGFYCYAIMWGINHKLISEKEYLPAAEKAWEALASSVDKNGRLGFVQPVGASPDRVSKESTGVYGVGAFLLAGVEMYKYMRQHSS